MKKILFTFSILLWIWSSLVAQTIPPLSSELEAMQPVNIFPAHPDSGYTFFDKSGATKSATFSVATQNNAPVFTAEIFTTAQSHFNIQSLWKNEVLIEKGDVLLARISIRAIYVRQGIR